MNLRPMIDRRWFALGAIFSLGSLFSLTAIPTGDLRWLAYLPNLAFLGFLWFLVPEKTHGTPA